jgi:TolA-binding protein
MDIAMSRAAVGTAIALTALSMTAGAAGAEGSAGADLAKRTYLNAEQLMGEGKADQALKAYQQVIQSFPDSPLVDDALLRVGAYYYPVETIGALGTVAVAGQDAARPSFEQIRERYPQSDSAPHALYKLGLLWLEPDSPKRNLDEAYASFYGVVNIYPDSEWVGSALLGAAAAELEKRNYDKAILSLERSLEASPHGAVAAESHYLLGLANTRLGDFARAAEAFQACRLEDDRSRFAARSLEWLTIIYDLRLKPAVGAPVEFTHDAGFVPRLPAGEDLRGDIGMAVSPAGELLVADAKRGTLLVFGEDGTMIRSEAMAGVRHVSIDAYGKIVTTSGTDIRIAGEIFPAARKSGSKVERLQEPAGAWRGSGKEIYVLDSREGDLLRYDSSPEDPKLLSRDKEAGTRLEVMAAGPEDRIYFLDAKQRQILVLDGGKLKAFKPPDAQPVLEDPVDMAVDALGDVLVADAKSKRVYLIGPDGKRLSTISPPAGSVAELMEPSAIAVGPKGEVFVYDSRKRTILRFR